MVCKPVVLILNSLEHALAEQYAERNGCTLAEAATAAMIQWKEHPEADFAELLDFAEAARKAQP